MSERKILVEVTEEEYELIKKGMLENPARKLSDKELIEEIKKRLIDRTSQHGYDAQSERTKVTLSGRIPNTQTIITIRELRD